MALVSSFKAKVNEVKMHVLFFNFGIEERQCFLRRTCAPFTGELKVVNFMSHVLCYTRKSHELNMYMNLWCRKSYVWWINTHGKWSWSCIIPLHFGVLWGLECRNVCTILFIGLVSAVNYLDVVVLCLYYTIRLWLRTFIYLLFKLSRVVIFLYEHIEVYWCSLCLMHRFSNTTYLLMMDWSHWISLSFS